jgi:hypothetical protein
MLKSKISDQGSEMQDLEEWVGVGVSDVNL